MDTNVACPLPGIATHHIEEGMEDLGILIPLIGVSIPLVVVAGKFIVQPIVQAITRVSTAQAQGQEPGPVLKRLAATEERLEQVERVLRQITEEQEFQRKLLAGRGAARPEKAGS